MAKFVLCLGILAVFVQGALSEITNCDAFNYYTMDAHCGYTMYTPYYEQVHLRLSDGNYRNNMACPFHLQTATDVRYSVHFETMDIEYHDDCGYDFLTIDDGLSVTSKSRKYNRICTISGDYTSSGNELTFYFKSDADTSGSGFLIVLTPFRTGTCLESIEYTCDNGRCIDRALPCVTDNLCGDFSDCEADNIIRCYASISPVIIIGSAVGVVFLAVLAVLVVVIILCRRRRTALQRNQTMGVATNQLPYTNTAMYSQPPTYAQVTQFDSQSYLQSNYGQPPPYTPTGGLIPSDNGIPFPSTTGAAPLKLVPPTHANTASAPPQTGAEKTPKA